MKFKSQYNVFSYKNVFSSVKYVLGFPNTLPMRKWKLFLDITGKVRCENMKVKFGLAKPTLVLNLLSAGDNHLQKSTLCAVIQVIKRHDINSSLTKFVWQFDREIIWDSCVIKVLYQTPAHNAFYIICQYFIQYKIRPVIKFNEWSLSHSGKCRYSDWRIPWTNAWW